MDYIHHYDSPLGSITLASDGQALIGLWFDGQQYFADNLSEEYQEKDLAVFEETARWLDAYFAGKDPGFIPPLKFRTTPFRREVWKILLTIPYGNTISYGKLAERFAREHGLERISAQAIGQAVSHNAILLIIPCHRVIGADGSLTGYAGGISKKEKLLALEQTGLISKKEDSD